MTAILLINVDMTEHQFGKILDRYKPTWVYQSYTTGGLKYEKICLSKNIRYLSLYKSVYEALTLPEYDICVIVNNERERFGKVADWLDTNKKQYRVHCLV